MELIQRIKENKIDDLYSSEIEIFVDNYNNNFKFIFNQEFNVLELTKNQALELIDILSKEIYKLK